MESHQTQSPSQQDRSQDNVPSDSSATNTSLSKEMDQNSPSASTSQPIAHQARKNHVRPCGRRRRHTISNNHMEFAFYLCLRDEIQEEDEGVEDGENEEEDEEEDPNYSRLSDRRQDQSLLFELHHCDVIVLKTDNGWCFDQEIFLPAWKRDSYEVAEQDSNGFSSSSALEFVKVDEIRLD